MARWVYCKYCYKHVAPRVLAESVCGETTHMTVCSECGYGLTPPESLIGSNASEEAQT
jgi:hypothetical protein